MHATQIAALQAELSTVAGEIVALKDQLNGCTARSWMAWQWGLTPAEAARCARAGERLAELPALSAAFAEGRLSEGVVDALVRVATPANEAELLETATVATGAQLQSLLRAYKKVRDADDDATPPDEWERRWTDDNGMWRASLCLTPEHGADLEAALAISRERCIDDERAARHAAQETSAAASPTAPDDPGAHPDAPTADDADRAGPRAPTASRSPSPTPRPDPAVDDAPPGDASLPDPVLDGEFEPRSALPPPGTAPPPPIRVPDTSPWVRLAQDQLCGATKADGTLPERFLTVVHVDEATLAATADARAHIAGIGAIDVPTAQRLLVQSWITFVVERKGKPVTATEPSRLATPAQRRALLARDPTCRFPGCSRTRRLRAHHMLYAARLGPTVLWNLLHLCDEHHHFVHEKGFTVTATPTTDPVWRDPRGKAINPGSLRAAPADRHAAPPPVSPRPTVALDPLTDFAANVIIEHWLAHAA